MINPQKGDTGRPVIYIGHRYWGGPDLYGVVKSWSESLVWVTFNGSLQAQGCRREDLQWLESRP